MKVRILTLFPGMVNGVAGDGMLKRAQAKGALDLRVVDLRTWTHDRHRTVDDTPYGGGPGMVMKPEPVFECLEALLAEEGTLGRVVAPTPRGRRLDMPLVRGLAREPHLTFLCGHYEGIDERVFERWVTDEISIGDYVLAGGELPALVMLEAAIRYVPGVLGNEASTVEESFVMAEGLEYPHYTRPSEYRGMRVPDVLRSGDHEAVRRWRREQAIKVTTDRRPDLRDYGTQKTD